MTGCGEEETPRPKPEPSDTEIMPQAVLAETRATLTGTVDGSVFAANTEGVFAVTAMLEKDSSDPKDVWFQDQAVHTISDSGLRFDEKQYYPYDPINKLYFYAYSPATGEPVDGNPMKVRFDLTGQEDILWAKDDKGIGKATYFQGNQDQPMFKFYHKLARINILCKRGIGFPDGIRLTKVVLHDQKYHATIDLASGNVECQGSTEFETNPNLSINALGFDLAGSFMIEPTGSLTISMSTSNNSIPFNTTIESKDLFASGGIKTEEFEAGYSYDVKFEFLATEIFVTTAVAPWSDGGISNGNEI